MQLDQYQRRALLYRTDRVFYNGGVMAVVPGIDPDRLKQDPALAKRRHKEKSSQPFLGDILEKDQAWILKCNNIGHNHARHAANLIKEVTGMPLGTQLDERTATAFAQAKSEVHAGNDPATSWPTWYCEGRPIPNE